MFKKFHGDIDSVYCENLDNYDDDHCTDDGEYRKIGSIRRLFKGLKKIITNQQEPIMVLRKQIITIRNMFVKEIDMKIYRQKNILI